MDNGYDQSQNGYYDCFGMGGGVCVGKVVSYGWLTGWWLGFKVLFDQNMNQYIKRTD